MKKAFIEILALTLVSTTSVFAEGGRKVKKAKAKVECSKGCPDKKDCHKTKIARINRVAFVTNLILIENPLLDCDGFFCYKP